MMRNVPGNQQAQAQQPQPQPQPQPQAQAQQPQAQAQQPQAQAQQPQAQAQQPQPQPQPQAQQVNPVVQPGNPLQQPQHPVIQQAQPQQLQQQPQPQAQQVNPVVQPGNLAAQPGNPVVQPQPVIPPPPVQPALKPKGPGVEDKIKAIKAIKALNAKISQDAALVNAAVNNLERIEKITSYIADIEKMEAANQDIKLKQGKSIKDSTQKDKMEKTLDGILFTQLKNHRTEAVVEDKVDYIQELHDLANAALPLSADPSDERTRLTNFTALNPEQDEFILYKQASAVFKDCEKLFVAQREQKISEIATSKSQHPTYNKKLLTLQKGKWEISQLLKDADPWKAIQALEEFLTYVPVGHLTSEQRNKVEDAKNKIAVYTAAQDPLLALTSEVINEYEAEMEQAIEDIEQLVSDKLYEVNKEKVTTAVAALPDISGKVSAVNAVIAIGYKNFINQLSPLTKNSASKSSSIFSININKAINGLVPAQPLSEVLNKLLNMQPPKLSLQQKGLVKQAIEDLRAFEQFESLVNDLASADPMLTKLRDEYTNNVKASLPEALRVCEIALNKFDSYYSHKRVLKHVAIAGVLMVVGVGILMVAAPAAAISASSVIASTTGTVGAAIGTFGATAYTFCSSALSGDIKTTATMLMPLLAPLESVAEMLGANIGSVYGISKAFSYISVPFGMLHIGLDLNKVGKDLPSWMNKALDISALAGAAGAYYGNYSYNPANIMVGATVVIAAPVIKLVAASIASGINTVTEQVNDYLFERT